MAKVHLNAAAALDMEEEISRLDPVMLTVWRKSLLFNCRGFTVFDAAGDLVFRVDNYSAASKDEIVLMDAAGKPLLTVRRKKLSFANQWLVCDGEAAVCLISRGVSDSTTRRMKMKQSR